MDGETKWFRIAEFEKRSGVSRRTIQFYVQEGLLHQPFKTGRTMAYYDDSHVNKLSFIVEKKELGAPLFAIREMIAELEKESPKAFGEAMTPAVHTKRKSAPVKRVPCKARSRLARESILEVGCQFFRQKGYKATKVSDITTQLNFAKGTFYYYFSDKKELFLECVPRIFTDLFSMGWDTIRREKNPLKRLELRAMAVAPVLAEFCSIIALSKEAIEDEDPKLNSLGEQILLSIRRPLESDIRKGIDEGIIRSIDPKIASATMLGAMDSLHYLMATDPEMGEKSFMNEVIGVLVSGIKQT